MAKEALTELYNHKKRLVDEEALIQKGLTEIEEQINALQLEQLLLIRMLRKPSGQEEKIEETQKNDKNDKELDLSVPAHRNTFMEEDEQEDDEDEEL